MNNSAPFSYSQMFYEQLPFYLSIGMTWVEYWEEDCVKVKYYRRAFELAKKRENQKLWLQGAYIYTALCDVSPVLHAFAKNGSQPLPYISEPFPLSESESVEQREEQERIKSEKAKAKLMAWTTATNKRMMGGEKNG